MSPGILGVDGRSSASAQLDRESTHRRYARRVPIRTTRSLPIRTALLVACACALLVLGSVPAAAVAAGGSGSGNSFSELTNGASQEESSTQTKTTSRTSNTTNTGTPSTSRTLVLAAIAAAVLLLSGIALVIVRDARRVAPASDPDLVEARAGHDAAVRLRKRRAQAKAARKQRRHNR
jgi:ABC-type Fe3+ transport system permease subunit